ncbi:hypothetical protein ACWEN6_15390 [Sphaerisporangium sp. NPDC004334]
MVVTGDAPVAMPLDRYLPSIVDIATVGAAVEVVAASCMHALGHRSWRAPDLSRIRRGGKDVEHDFFPYLDPVKAARSGYAPPGPDPVPSGFPGDSQRRPLSEAEKLAYRGAPGEQPPGAGFSGGCLGEGERKVRGRLPRLPVDARMLAGDSQARARTDSRVREAIEDWKRCMAANGLAYPDPMLARLDPRWSRQKGTPASAEERRVAAIDASCQKSVNFVGVYKTVRKAYQERFLSEHHDEIIDSVRVFGSWLANAREILATG